jgi:hypothetical protein
MGIALGDGKVDSIRLALTIEFWGRVTGRRRSLHIYAHESDLPIMEEFSGAKGYSLSRLLDNVQVAFSSPRHQVKANCSSLKFCQFLIFLKGPP